MSLQELNDQITAKVKELLPSMVGITKKEIAMQLDAANKLFNYSAETGKTSYHNYTRHQLIETCVRFNIDPISDYHKRRAGK